MKFVRLNARGSLTEIDKNRLKREARALASILADLESDPNDLAGTLMPLLTEAIANTLSLPVERAPLPITHMEDAGVIFPQGFLEAYCGFFLTAQGYRYDYDRIEHRDDGDWVWVEMEGDQ